MMKTGMWMGRGAEDPVVYRKQDWLPGYRQIRGVE